MNWFDILKAQYHVTTKDKVDTILREGLKPSEGGLLRNSVWTFNNYEDALMYSKGSKYRKDTPVILEIEPDEHIKFQRGPRELVGTGGKSGMPGKLLETAITTQHVTGDINVV